MLGQLLYSCDNQRGNGPQIVVSPLAWIMDQVDEKWDAVDSGWIWEGVGGYLKVWAEGEMGVWRLKVFTVVSD